MPDSFPTLQILWWALGSRSAKRIKNDEGKQNLPKFCFMRPFPLHGIRLGQTQNALRLQLASESSKGWRTLEVSSAAMIIVDGGKGSCTSWQVKTIKRTQLLRKSGRIGLPSNSIFLFFGTVGFNHYFVGLVVFSGHALQPSPSSPISFGFSVTGLAGESNMFAVEKCV